MKVSKRQLLRILIGLFLALSINFFYLGAVGFLPLTDMALMIALIVFVIAIRYFPRVKYDYFFYALFAMVLAVTSSYEAHRLNGQSYLLGIRPQRFYLICWMLYFALIALLKKKKIAIKDLIKIVKILGYICLGLFSLQFILGERLMFLAVSYNYRYGTIRLYASTIFIDLLFAFSLSEQIKSPTLKKKNIIPIVWSIAYIILVNKGRKMTLCYLIVLAFAVLLWRKGKYKKLLVALFAVALVGSMMTDEMIDSILSLSVTSGEQNVLLRSYALQYWMKNISQHWLLGGGIVNTQYTPAVKMAGIQKNFFFVDNGFFGFLYQYGFLGAIWNVLLFIKIIKDGMKIYKTKNESIILLMMAFIILGFRGGGWISYNYSTFTIVFICVLTDFYVHRKKESMIERRKLRGKESKR